MTGCSKAPRGLSVLRRVMRIFTHATISPSLSLRQQLSRYAIRAGRNFTFFTVSSGVDYTFICRYDNLTTSVSLLAVLVKSISKLNDTCETFWREMFALVHTAHNFCE